MPKLAPRPLLVLLLLRPESRLWLLGKNMGVGVEALLGKKCRARFAMGVGGGERVSSVDPKTREACGDSRMTLMMDLGWILLLVDVLICAAANRWMGMILWTMTVFW